MTKEEQLKIYAAYLPYDLKVCTSYNLGTSWNKPKKLLGADIDRFRTNVKYKPILYDLSHLTKEIEHEGKKIIPIVELYKKANSKANYGALTSGVERTDKGQSYNFHVFEDGKHVFKFSTYTNGYGTFFLDNLMIINAYSLYQELLKLHFNFFNIPPDQFINKATLKQ
ncbi:hypothetical protein ACMGDK_11275 [Chryseobacterium sp. DT-3]|uniref:hypothetical protein n=1 Tax=Chryseobacterium sp. DT-3 TaxID=3396164 RepID=UPI003F19E828